jgi:hypothetical protein
MKPGFSASPGLEEEAVPLDAAELPLPDPGSVTVAPRDPDEGAPPLVAAVAPAGAAPLAALGALGAADNGVGAVVVICGGVVVEAAAAAG